MLGVGDYIVYKKDICVISEIKEIRGEDYFILKPVDDDSLTVSLPAQSNSYREIISSDDALNFIKRISSIDEVSANNDKALEVIYKKLIMSLDNDDLIRIIKTTYMRNKHRADKKKRPGSVDSYFLEEAEKRLFLELATALHLDIDVIKDMVVSELNK